MDTSAIDNQDLLDAGSLLVRSGQVAEAEPIYRELLRRSPGNPTIRMALAVVLLSLGRYAEAWPFYEARFEVPGADAKPQLPWPEWNGESLVGRRLLVFPEQGLGDQIMFARFAMEQQRLGAEVTVLCRRPLAALFRASGLTAIATTGQVTFPDPEYWVMSNSLAARSGITHPQAIDGKAYLRSSPAAASGRIGVVVRGNPLHHNDANRSLDAASAARLLALPTAVSLAPEDTGAQDLAETAEIIRGLDVVVSVDTAVAHLAGAMGKDVRVLLPRTLSDWRWGVGSTTTPWYRSMQLYRQVGDGWSETLAQVLADLQVH